MRYGHGVHRPGTRRALTTYLPAALVLIGTGALLYYIGSLRYSLPEAVLVIVLVTAVVLLVQWALTRTGLDIEPPYWVSAPRQETAPPAAMDYRLLRLRRDLRDALERDDRTDQIYPVLRELAAERLRARHDIDLDAQPEEAGQHLTPGLRKYLAHPPTGTRRRSKSALHHAIEGIEKI